MFKDKCTLVKICRLADLSEAALSGLVCQAPTVRWRSWRVRGQQRGRVSGITRSLGGKEALMVSKARLKEGR